MGGTGPTSAVALQAAVVVSPGGDQDVFANGGEQEVVAAAAEEVYIRSQNSKDQAYLLIWHFHPRYLKPQVTLLFYKTRCKQTIESTIKKRLFSLVGEALAPSARQSTDTSAMS
jgi:hypothetical protein